jgi:integrase
VQPPKRKKVQGSAIRRDDIAALLRELSDHRLEPALLFALATGMRRGEVCGLRDRSVNRGAKTALVREARADDGRGGWRQKATKTEHERVVPLNPLAMRALALETRLRKERAKIAASAWRDSGFAFVDELGAAISPDALTDAFRRAFARVEAVTGRHHRLHDLRHTAASLMLGAGADVGTVRDVLGHADASTTLGIYAHAIEGGKRRAVNSIDAAIRATATRRSPKRTTS